MTGLILGLLGVVVLAGQAFADVPAAKAKDAAAKPPPPKYNITRRTSAEVSGYTSETSDQFYTRLNLSESGGPTNWWLRAGYALSKTRSYSGSNVSETTIDSYSLDGQWRTDGKDSYKFIAANVNIRDRSPYTAKYGDRSGYYMVSAGYGKTVLPGIESELALANMTQYDDETDRRVTVVSSVRVKKGLTDAMSFDADANIVEPFSSDPLIDSQANITYKFNPALSLRFSYKANNLLQPVNSPSGWDKSFRVSLVFSRTTK